jgi:hypothetical protein
MYDFSFRKSFSDIRDRRGRDRMALAFTTTYAISIYIQKTKLNAWLLFNLKWD